MEAKKGRNHSLAGSSLVQQGQLDERPKHRSAPELLTQSCAVLLDIINFIIHYSKPPVTVADRASEAAWSSTDAANAVGVYPTEEERTAQSCSHHRSSSLDD